MNKIQKIILTLFLFSLSFVPFLWLQGNQILLGYDNVYPLSPLDFLKDRIFSWTPIVGWGADQSGIQGSLIVHFFDSLPQFVGLSQQMSQKITYSFWFLLILASAYFLITRLERANIVESKYLRYFFPILYAFNFYILQAWWIAERTKFSLVVATPLILSIILPMVVSSLSFNKVLKNAFICALILTIFNGGGWVGFPLYGGLLVILVAIYLFFSVIYLIKKRKRDLLFFNLFFVLFGASFALVNAYTLLPFVLTTLKSYAAQMSTAGGVISLIEWAKYLSANSNLINLFRLEGIPDMYNSIATHPYASFYLDNAFIIVVSFVFPLLFLLALLYGKESNKKIISLFLFLVILSVFFTSGINGATGKIFRLLMEKIPGFAVFRSPIYKFGYAYWFSVSFLIGLSISNLLEFIFSRVKKESFIHKLKIGFPIIIIVLIVLYYHPYITGDIFRISSDKVSSRVEIPSYIYDFSNWWKKAQNNNKILLLPRLNENWVFEQYRWGYLSLFPVLANFADIGLVENTDGLSEQENTLLLKLYSSINNGDYEMMDRISSLLGISYFLVRKDFDYTIPDQETDSPFLIEKSIINNKNLRFDQSFGEWDVYRYNNLKNIISVNSSAIASNEAKSYPFSSIGDLLIINDLHTAKFEDTVSDSVIVSACVSCGAEKENVQVTIPKPQVLMDSRLYQLVKLKNRLSYGSNETYDQKVFKSIGDGLKLVGQFEALVMGNKEEYYIELARIDYINIVNEISQQLKTVETASSNPYSTIIKVERYLDAESYFLNNLLLRSDKKYVHLNAEKMLYEINNLNDELKKIYSEKDFNKKKHYRYNIAESGNYSFKILRNSVGSIDANDLSNISIILDERDKVISGTLNGDFIDFGEIYLLKGNHSLRLNLPAQKNLISNFVSQRISGSDCYSSIIDDVSSKSAYDLSFISKNNFDPVFFSFTDMNREDVFEPANLNYFPLSGEVEEKNRMVIFPAEAQLNTRKNNLRVAFCSPSLTESLYKNNIKNLNFVLLSEPKIFIHSDIADISNLTPRVEFQEVNQTHYEVFIKGAKNPFYLVFNQRYSLGWVATEGKHLMSNGINNAWYINKQGDFSLDIYYYPQRYFYYGIVVTVISIVLIFSFLYFSKRYES